MKNRVKEKRKAMGLRQQDLAVQLRVSRQTIVAIENDKYNPTLELAMRLARFLSTPVEQLFLLEEEEKREVSTLYKKDKIFEK